MEAIYLVLGLSMMYFLVHALVILIKNLDKFTVKYDRIVLIVSMVSVALLVLGIMTS